MLADPHEVLSAMRMCCQSPWRYTSALLGSLLIKAFGVFAEFYGEQGLHTGVQVEGFTGPAGTDRLRVWMLEAVHRSQLIMLRSPPA